MYVYIYIVDFKFCIIHENSLIIKLNIINSLFMGTLKWCFVKASWLASKGHSFT